MENKWFFNLSWIFFILFIMFIMFLVTENIRVNKIHSELKYSHTLHSNLHCETYIGISQYRSLAVVELQSMEVMLYMTWSCEKIQMLFLFRAIWENTAHVQWIKCSPKGSHLIIHCTSAVFFHIALKWTPFAYLIVIVHVCHTDVYIFI